MEQSLECSTPSISAKSIINDIESLVKRKEDGHSVDLAEYQQTLEKIEIITYDRANISLLQNLPEEVVIKILQLHDRAKKLSWNKLTTKLRALVVVAGEKQSHDVVEQILELLLNYKAVHEEINFELLLTASGFDVVKWIKKGANLNRLANYLQQFKFTRTALETLHFVMTRSELTEVIENELSVPTLDTYLRLTKHKGAALAMSIWQTFNQPKYYELIKQLSPEIQLEWIIFIVQHYKSEDFEEKYLDLFKSLVLCVDVSLLPRAFKPGHLLNEHFFIKIMRDNQKKTFDFLMQAGYNFATFKKKGRALHVAIQLCNSHFVKEILKRKLINLKELEHIDRAHLLKMKDLHIYQLMHDGGFDFTKEPLVPNSDLTVDYPFMNALMDWHLSKRQTKVLSLKRLCIIEVKANNISDERLPHDLREDIDEYKELWYWLNWSDDEDEKIYWKDVVQYLLKTATVREEESALVDFKLKTIHEDNIILRIHLKPGGYYYSSYFKPSITLPYGYRNIPQGYHNTMDNAMAENLGVSMGDLPVLYGLMSLVAVKLTSEADPAGQVKSEQPFWLVYNPTAVWTADKLTKWYEKIMRVMIETK